MSPFLSNGVTIVGAGITGLALAHILAQANISVTVIEQQPRQWSPIRVSALNRSSCDFLKNIGAWQSIQADRLTGFSTIEAWVHDSQSAIHFDAANQGQRYLGYIVLQDELVRVLWGMATVNKNITLHCPLTLTALSDIKDTSFIVGADGATSWVRQHVGIDCEQRTYGQKAIVATVMTEKPHGAVARQRFLKTGPLGVLPLSDPYHVSIVWSSDDDDADTLMSFDELAFNRALSNALELQLGYMKLITKRYVFPLVMRHAKQYVTSNVILVGDAAHTLHPLAGQGVNLGLKDVMNLSQRLIALHEKGQWRDDTRELRAYERERRTDNSIMQAIMWAFHFIRQPVGFKAFDKCDTLKQWVIPL